jgi:Sensors of blue-light using FAD
MLVRLLYASRSKDTITADLAESILNASRTNNPVLGVTGLLCMCPNSQVFMQVLEGGRAAVNSLYSRISQDPRHHDVVILHYEEITERRFSGWAMGQVNTTRINASNLLKYSEKPVLDPFNMPGHASMALLNELIDTASIGSHRST